MSFHHQIQSQSLSKFNLLQLFYKERNCWSKFRADLLRLEELLERLLELKTKFREANNQIHRNVDCLFREKQNHKYLLDVHLDDGWKGNVGRDDKQHLSLQ